MNGYAADGRRDLVVKNGAVRGFRVGVRSGGRGTQLRRLTIAKNATGGVILRGSTCVVERNTIVDNGYGHGIFVLAAGNCLIEANRVTRHLGAGIKTSRSSGNTIEDNRVYSNRREGIMLVGTEFLDRRAQLGLGQPGWNLPVRPVERGCRAPQLSVRQRHGHRPRIWGCG